MRLKESLYNFIARGEPLAKRIDTDQAEQLYWSLSPVTRWVISKVYPYIQPPSKIREKGFIAPPGMRFDNSLAAARLRSLAMSQIERLWQAKRAGYKIVGLAQDAGQLLPFLIGGKRVAWFSFESLGGAYIATSVEQSAVHASERIGVRRESCPIIKACIGLLTEGIIPEPDLIIAQTGASCDDHAVQMQLKEWLGYPVHWLELPYRRSEQAYFHCTEHYQGSGGLYQRGIGPFYRNELEILKHKLEDCLHDKLTDQGLRQSLRKINTFRQCLRRIFHRVAMSEYCLWPAIDQLLLHVAAMDCYGNFVEMLDIAQHISGLITYRDRKRVAMLPRESSRYTPRILWMMPVVEMNLPSMLEDVGARISGWEMPHLIGRDYRMDIDPLTAMAEDYLHFPLLGDCEIRLMRLKKFLDTYRVDGVIYSSIWSCTQMPIQAGIVKDFLRNYNIPMLMLDIGNSGSISGQMRTRIEAFAENLPVV
jgi:2-hydroxyglutaryl-CoA dehydratase, D-component